MPGASAPNATAGNQRIIQGYPIKIAVILRRSDARRAKMAGITQPEPPVECLNGVPSCPKPLLQTHWILQLRRMTTFFDASLGKSFLDPFPFVVTC